MRNEHDANRALVQTHGNRALTERRQSTQESIDYYQHQAQLARHGLTTRRSEAFYLRQVAYFTLFGA